MLGNFQYRLRPCNPGFVVSISLFDLDKAYEDANTRSSVCTPFYYAVIKKSLDFSSHLDSELDLMCLMDRSSCKMGRIMNEMV